LSIDIPGEAPVAEGVELAPFYDLVNTRIHLPGDEFAVPLDGRRSNLRLRSFERLGARWGMDRAEVRGETEAIVEGTREHLDAVLRESGLAADLQRRYRTIVNESIQTVGC
jgi:hypothetical protein